MNFFKKLFGLNDQTIEKKQEAPAKIASQSAYRSIADFFDFDIYGLPDDSFALVSEDNESKYKTKTYRKELITDKFGLFTHVEVLKFENGEYNLFFYNYEANSISRSELSSFVDALSSLYGPDSIGETVLTDRDWEDYTSDFPVMDFGRNWRDTTRTNPLALDKFDDELKLSIWGLK